MQSEYASGVIKNVFTVLNQAESLTVLGLSLAANDLLVNVEAIGKIPRDKNSYFFYTSIAIVREIAKLVASVEKSTLAQKFSEGTMALHKELMDVLGPYHDDSLAKSVLKPIRDVTFHYDLSQSGGVARWGEIFDRTAKLEQLDVGLMPNNKSLLGQRYTFADQLRSEYVNQFLTQEIVSRLSSVSVRIGAFVDSLLTDLVHKHENGREGRDARTP